MSRAYLLLFPFCVALQAQDWAWLDKPYSLDLHAHYDHFQTPIEIDFDADGNLYIVDLFGCSVHKISPTGEVLYSFGRPGSGPGEFQASYDLSVDRERNRVWVSDQRSRKVACFETTGRLLFEMTPKNQPYSIACRSSDGFLVVGGTGSNNLTLYNSKGEFIKAFGRDMERPMEGARLKSHISRFMYLAFGPGDFLYVAYLKEPVLACYDKDGTLVWEKERPWTKSDQEPMRTIDKGMTFRVQEYHANFAILNGTVFMSTSVGENAMIAMDAKIGAYLGFRKPLVRARGLATLNGKIVTLNASEGTLHLYQDKPDFTEVRAHPDYENRYEIEDAIISSPVATPHTCVCGCSGDKEKDKCTDSCCSGKE